MSGIYGFSTAKNDFDPKTILENMRHAAPVQGPSMPHQWIDQTNRIGLGTAHPRRVGDLGYFAENKAAGVYGVLDGVIYQNLDLSDHDPVASNGAAVLLNHYLTSGTAGLSHFSGDFNGAWWDENARRLTVVTDKLGQRLLFYSQQNDKFVFASHLAAVMASGLVSPEIDLEAFAELISFAHVLGERTLFKHVKIAPPGAVMTWKNGQVTLDRYWRLDEIEPQGTYNQGWLDQFEALFKQAIRRSFRPDITTAIDLTGGRDSRCLLAAAAHLQLPFITHTGGQIDSTDVVLAQQVAAAAGAQHVFEPIGPEKVADWLVPMVRYQGGIVSTLHSHPCQHFEMPLPFDAVVQGIGINYIRGHWVTSKDLDSIHTLTDAQNFLKGKIASKTIRKINPEQLWKPNFKQTSQQADVHLRGLFDQYKRPDGFVGMIDCISLQERCRKFLNKAIIIVRAAREVYYPYLDHDLILALAKLPTSERVNNKIQDDLIKRFYPELLKIPIEKTMMPMAYSPTQTWITQRYRAARRRASRHLGLPDTRPAKVPSHYYSQWIRNHMREALLDLLSNPKAAFRAYLQGDVIDTLLDQHFTGKEDWEHLIGALTVFEVSHRLWVDPDPQWSQSVSG